MPFAVFGVTYPCRMSDVPVEAQIEYLFDDVRILRATRTPCIVCGHATGDCTGDSHPPRGIVGLGTIPSIKHGQMVLVEEDIIEERTIFGSTTTRVLVARKGSYVSLEKAQELGIA